jgi:N-acetylglucosamine-6-phosphate deacetylase
LSATGYEVKTAVVMALAGVDVDEARRRLTQSGGHVRRAVAEPGTSISVSAEPLLFVVHGRVYAPGRTIENGMVAIASTRVVAVGTPQEVPVPQEARTLDARGLAVVPGLIDLHIHGVSGFDAMAGQAAGMAQVLPRFGVTAFLPTTLSAPLERTKAALEGLSRAMDESPRGARILGIHMEGSYLSPQMPGMMDRSLFRPLDWDEFVALNQAAGGRVRMLTFAPEVQAAGGTIPRLLEAGVVPSIGHSAATFEEVRQAVGLGLAHATHTYNAMRPFHHREPGVVGAVWQFDQITAELIADGHHVHPVAMQLLLRLKTEEHMALVSDATPVAGLPAGHYQWAGATLVTDGQTARLPNGTLAGSVALMNTGLRHLVELAGLSLERALVSAAQVPARILGLSKGELAPGYDADLAILGHDFQPILTMVEGQVVFTSKEPGSNASRGSSEP